VTRRRTKLTYTVATTDTRISRRYAIAADRPRLSVFQSM